MRSLPDVSDVRTCGNKVEQTIIGWALSVMLLGSQRVSPGLAVSNRSASFAQHRRASYSQTNQHREGPWLRSRTRGWPGDICKVGR